MQRFDNILICLDPQNDPEAAVKRVESFAVPGGVTLTALHVLSDGPDAPSAEQVRQRLTALVSSLREAGVEVAVEVRAGRPDLVILDAVAREGHDLVVKVIEHEDWFKRAFYSTTDLHLLRRCPAPVLLVEPSRVGPLRRVLVAVDLWAEPEGLALNEKCLSLGRSLAHLDGAELHVVYVQRYYGGEETRERRQDLVHRWSGERPSTRFHFLKGDPREAIPRLVDEADIDLVVMGTVGRTGIAGLLVGNTAESVIGQIESALLAVKPSGFVPSV